MKETIKGNKRVYRYNIFTMIFRLLGIAQIPLVFKDISNYMFIRSVLKKEENTEEFKNMNLNKAWFGTTYTVINLPPEVQAANEDIWQVYVLEQILGYDEYFRNIGLTEIIVPRIDNLVNKKAGVFAYGVRFVPLRLELDMWYVLQLIVVWSLIIGGLQWIL